MEITEWFTRAVAAGLMPDSDNIRLSKELVPSDGENKDWYLIFSNGKCIRRTEITCKNITYPTNCDNIQLRKDGVNCFGLWTKEDIPTEKHIGKMCYFMKMGGIFYDKLYSIEDISPSCDPYIKYHARFISAFKCLLANHGQIAPTEQDFKRIYGGK